MNRRKLASDPGYAKSAAQSFELDSEAMTKDQKDHKQEAEALIKRDDLSKAHKFTQVTAKPVWIYVTCNSIFPIEIVGPPPHISIIAIFLHLQLNSFPQ